MASQPRLVRVTGHKTSEWRRLHFQISEGCVVAVNLVNGRLVDNVGNSTIMDVDMTAAVTVTD